MTAVPEQIYLADALEGSDIDWQLLIVDDDPSLREIVRFALEREGFASIQAADGREALQQFRPDVFESYPSALSIMLRHAAARGTRLHRPRLVTTSGEYKYLGQLQLWRQCH